MEGTPGISIRQEAAVSVVINGGLSLAFFLAIFGTKARALSWTAPDRLALDFVPQSLAVALMSALVPALIARRRLGGAPTLRPILVRAAGFALAGGALGGLLALLVGGSAAPPIAWAAALIGKIAYGGALGALITSLALGRLLPAPAA